MFQMMDRLKRILFPTFFFLGAAWLVWCGNVYNDKNYSLIPAFMCACGVDFVNHYRGGDYPQAGGIGRTIGVRKKR